ncbi:MAG: hypothetical protein J0I36_14275 [Pandoraea sp.]|nr:hypothetical protein [Pandoraea sp.]
MSRIMNFASPVLFPLAFAIVLPFVVSSPTLAGSVLVYAVAAMACNLLLGYGGLLSFCQGTFFGLGGYLFGLALLRGHCGVLTALVVAIVGCGLIAGLIGAVAIRRKGLYFVMLTLAFAQLFYFIAYSLPALTGGDNGMEERIYVRGDKTANYGAVMQVMGAINGAGFTHIGLIALKEPDS